MKNIDFVEICSSKAHKKKKNRTINFPYLYTAITSTNNEQCVYQFVEYYEEATKFYFHIYIKPNKRIQFQITINNSKKS